MRERLGLQRHGLTMQMIVSYVALVLLTAVATGLPAILLIREQSERQAWTQVAQGTQATQALYAAWQSKVADLATLTSQRPTLQALLIQADQPDLPDYLRTLQSGTELDLLMVCDTSGQLIAGIGTAVHPNLCDIPKSADYYAHPLTTPTTLWLLAAHEIEANAANLGMVIVGVALDAAFAQQMRDQTSLEHIFVVNNAPLSSSLPNNSEDWNKNSRRVAQPPVPGLIDAAMMNIDGHPYYTASVFPNNAYPAFSDEVALPVDSMIAAQSRLVWLLLGSIFLAALTASALGLFLAQRIGRPLAQLAAVADTFRQGELQYPVTVRSGVREVSLVAQALEQARAELQRTIDELQQANAWSDHLMESVVEGIVALNENGRITFFSPGAERITGWSQKTALGQNADDIFRLAGSSEAFSRHLPEFGRRQKVTVQFDDNRQATLAITVARLTLPTTQRGSLVLVLRDVTEAEIMHRLMGEFMANITHEFRTPLAALAASAELLLEQAHELSAAELQDLLVSLHLGILGLATLIDNLLESARLEAGHFRVHLHPANLNEIIADAIKTMEPLQAKFGHRLTVTLPTRMPPVQADARRMIQVLVNLLSNAIQYSPDNSEIAIRAIVQDNGVQVTVADRGPGVSPGSQSDLFRPFVHTPQKDGRLRHGIGLGLSVVKAIVEAHGGQVGVSNRPDGGAMFWFTLRVVDE